MKQVIFQFQYAEVMGLLYIGYKLPLQLGFKTLCNMSMHKLIALQ